jgi:hypothetical protein
MEDEAQPSDGTEVVDGDGDGPPSVTLGPNLIVAAAIESNIRALFKSGAPSMEVRRTAATMPHLQLAPGGFRRLLGPCSASRASR